jgi:acyl carrier protein
VTPPAPLFEAIRTLVGRIAGPGRTPTDSGPETPLSEAGFWLDSVELLEIVVACEEEFGITFDATQDFAGETFKTLGTLAALIHAKRALVRADP